MLRGQVIYSFKNKNKELVEKIKTVLVLHYTKERVVIKYCNVLVS